MAALRLGTAAVEGRFQANGGLIPSSRILAASRNPPNREEPALGAAAANGAVLRAKPRGNMLPAAKAKRRRGLMPLWRVAVFASVALNVATLALLIHHYANHQQHPAIMSPHQHHHTCLPQSDASGESSKSKNGAPARQEESRESVMRAPSTGKPAVTPDSVINLDHSAGPMGWARGATPEGLGRKGAQTQEPRGQRPAQGGKEAIVASFFPRSKRRGATEVRPSDARRETATCNRETEIASSRRPTARLRSTTAATRQGSTSTPFLPSCESWF